MEHIYAHEIGVLCLLVIGLVGFGCAPAEPPEEVEPVAAAEPEVKAEPAEETPVPEEPAEAEEPGAKEPEPGEARVAPETEGAPPVTVWAPGKEGVLMKGLDGGLYEPYHPVTVENVQRALQTKGLFAGEVTGILDEATMKALGEFQSENGLQVSGVPTPRTRVLLLTPPPDIT